MDQVTEEILGIFSPTADRKVGKSKFLHNGVYPCYSLYQTKDKKYVALAAVEEKFWMRFTGVFNIKTDLDRFHFEDSKLFDILAEAFSKLSQQEIATKIQGEDLCLSIIN